MENGQYTNISTHDMQRGFWKKTMIRLFATGGTIDVDHIAPDNSYCFDRSFLPAMLAQSRCSAAVELQILFLKDSLHLTDADRSAIVGACQSCEEERILISHGTDSMAETARTLGAAGIPKTIVLFGAAVPFIKPASDAVFNLGFALAVVQQLPAGVYVAMNGGVFSWNDVRKNRETGFFETLS